MLSHRALLANLDQLDRIEPPVLAADDRMLLVLPLFHVYGLNAALEMVLRSGATGVLARRFDPVETLANVRRHGVTCIVGAPPMYVAWSFLKDLGDSLASVRLMLSGAAPLPAGVAETTFQRLLSVVRDADNAITLAPDQQIDALNKIASVELV